MAEFHFNHTATLLADGRVLVAGGGPSEVATAELYDPSNGKWTATGGMAKVRFGHTATLLANGRVLVAGGLGGDRLATAELYDTRTGSWTATGSTAEPHVFHTATLLADGRVLVAGGGPTAELYDPSNGTWTATGNMIEARYGHTATLLADGRVLVAGGFRNDASGGDPLATAESYDPSSGRWTATGKMIEARYGPTATLLANGRVLVVGGYRKDVSGDDALASAELYDPSSSRWTATASMAEARSNAHCGWPYCGHMATLLPDGRVLVTGGGNDPEAVLGLTSAELYDPTSARWTTTASMVVGRVGATATLLRDGTVLVAGGDFSGGPEDVASAELYDLAGGFSDVEASLLSGLRPDARFACAARRADLPAGAVAGVECSPEVDLIDRIGVYLFTAQDELLETYFDRLADYGVEPRSGSCPKGAGETVYVPGDGGPTFGPYRFGCYLNEFGNANYRFTAPDSLVYVGVLGSGRELAALHDWAWLGNQDVPGGPTLWREPVR